MITASARTDAARNALGSLAVALIQASQDGMREGLDAGQAIARGLATSVVKRRTGLLFKSIGHSERGYTGKLFARAPYALYIEGGTKAHVIEGRNGGMLRFMWHGVMTFRRRVMHPGTPPRPFMSRSADPTAAAITNATQRWVDAAARRFSS